MLLGWKLNFQRNHSDKVTTIHIQYIRGRPSLQQFGNPEQYRRDARQLNSLRSAAGKHGTNAHNAVVHGV
jgi:hypothetical protein